jgi:hypothetical protein
MQGNFKLSDFLSLWADVILAFMLPVVLNAADREEGPKIWFGGSGRTKQGRRDF